jgi:hypothetical protein
VHANIASPMAKKLITAEKPSADDDIARDA